MISVGEAKNILAKVCKPLTPATIPLQKAMGLVLAQNVFAAVDVPAFNQSSMDGYAFLFEDWRGTETLMIEGVVQAGSHLESPVQAKQAVRIFTGAAVPKNLDTVVMQEKVLVQGNQLIIKDDLLKQGGNVRLKGSEIEVGDLALEKGTKLSPAAIGFLAGIGIKEVLVYPKPRVKLIITGNELAQPGEPLGYGQVYESNSFAVSAALQQMGIDAVISFAKDNREELKVVLEDGLKDSDILLITGGVSVGDYDFVANTLADCGVEKLFHRIKQRPGKPLFAGRKGNQMVFGLPGNPSSVLTCFYEYVVPSLSQLMNTTTSIIQYKSLPLAHSFAKANKLTNFLKAHCTDEKVTILNAQESYRLSSFATANCLVCLGEDEINYNEGDMVEVHLIN